MNATTDTSGQETTTVDEFAGISADDISSLLDGTAEEIALEQSNSEETDPNTDANTSINPNLSPEQISEMIKTGVSEAVQSVSQQPAQNQNGQQPSFEVQMEKHLTENLKTKHGLSEEGAGFMTSAMMEGLKPIMTMMTQGFQALQQKSTNLETQTTLADIDRNLESWLDNKGIASAQDRDDVITIAKANTAKIPNANLQTLRAEFEKVSARHLSRAVQEEENTFNQSSDDHTQIPPTPKGNRIGFNDVVQKIVKSQETQDDIGGDRFVSAVERMISNGVQGGGQ